MTNQTYVSLTSLAMDLKRVALGKYTGSHSMAERFLTEAIKRKKEVNMDEVDSYVREILKKVEYLKKDKDAKKVAEDALMFSTLLQNYSIKEL